MFILIELDVQFILGPAATRPQPDVRKASGGEGASALGCSVVRDLRKNEVKWREKPE